MEEIIDVLLFFPRRLTVRRTAPPPWKKGLGFHWLTPLADLYLCWPKLFLSLLTEAILAARFSYPTTMGQFLQRWAVVQLRLEERSEAANSSKREKFARIVTIESGCHIKISSRPPSPTTVLPLLLLSASTFISCGRHNLNTLKRLGAPTAWVWWPKISNQDALSEKTLVICVVSWRHNSLIFMVAPAGLIFCLMNHCFYCSLVVSWIDSFARGGLLYDFKCYRLM